MGDTAGLQPHTALPLGVLGSINLDLVVRADHLPRPGETVLGGDAIFLPGGKGANQAVAAQRAGSTTRFAAMVGTDEFATTLLGDLAVEGLDPRFVTPIEGGSGMAMITIDRQGENQIVVAQGANRALDSTTAQRLIDSGFIDGLAALLAPCETPMDGIETAFIAAHAANCVTMLNAAPAPPLSTRLLEATDVLIANEVEVCELAGDPDWARAAAAMAGNVSLVLVTLGAAGTWVSSSGQARTVPSMTIEPVDTVGAGDAFCGNFAAAFVAAGLARENLADARFRDAIDRLVLRANAGGALCALQEGARSSPTKPELDQAMESMERYTS